MTQQEALAQALHDWECQGQPCTIMGSHQASASAILEALPEGWVFVNGNETASWLGEATEYAMRDGAQQERERLRPVLDAAKRVSEQDYKQRPDLFWAALDVLDHVLADLDVADPDEETP